jgi:hypothetical protein
MFAAAIFVRETVATYVYAIRMKRATAVGSIAHQPTNFKSVSAWPFVEGLYWLLELGTDSFFY